MWVFFVAKNHGFLVIEVKNVTVKDSEELSLALVRKSMGKKKDGMVSERHMYYYQIQQQLLVNRTHGVILWSGEVMENCIAKECYMIQLGGLRN